MSKNAIRLSALALIVVAVLFPAVGVAAQWPLLDGLFAAILPDRQAHNIGHIALFLVVGVLLQVLFVDLHRRFVVYFGVMLLIIVGQELLQLPAKQQLFSFDDVNDLFLDLVGAVLGHFLFALGSRLRARTNTKQP